MDRKNIGRNSPPGGWRALHVPQCLMVWVSLSAAQCLVLSPGPSSGAVGEEEDWRVKRDGNLFYISELQPC